MFDSATGRYTLYAGCGGVVRLKRELAGALDVPEAQVRVVARQIGGNFGTRNACYPEFILVACAARRIGQCPVPSAAPRGAGACIFGAGRSWQARRRRDCERDRRPVGGRKSNVRRGQSF